MEQPDLEQYAKEVVEKAVRENDPDEKSETCAQYEDNCDAGKRLQSIREMLDRPHGDDSPCEDPVWEAIDGILNHVMNGMEEALGLE